MFKTAFLLKTRKLYDRFFSSFICASLKSIVTVECPAQNAGQINLQVQG